MTTTTTITLTAADAQILTQDDSAANRLIAEIYEKYRDEIINLAHPDGHIVVRLTRLLPAETPLPRGFYIGRLQD